MPIMHDEIIEDLEGNMRKFGGRLAEWCAGTAKDSRGPFFRRHFEAELGDGLAYREAFTTSAAQSVVAHLVNDRGLEPVPEAATHAERNSGQQDPGTEAERRSALQAVSDPGKIVFVYRKTPPAAAAPRSDPATFPRRAA